MITGVDIGKLNDTAIRRWLKFGFTRDFRDARYPEIRLRASCDQRDGPAAHDRGFGPRIRFVDRGRLGLHQKNAR